jgi:stage II sporulation protein AB (anti-sigma F factor)
MAQTPQVDVEFPANPGGVRSIRDAAIELGNRAGMSAERLADLQTIAGEAASNAAIHAYEGGGGTIGFRGWIDGDLVAVEISDRGMGLRPGHGGRLATDPGGSEDEASRLRLGLAAIAAFSAHYSIEGGAGLGTTVRAEVGLV